MLTYEIILFIALISHVHCDISTELNISDHPIINEGDIAKKFYIKKLIIWNGVYTIGKNAFISWISLIEVEIHDSTTIIDDGAFMNCVKLQTIIFGKNIESIGNSAFENCMDLIEVILPNGIKYLGSNSFNSCACLINVFLGNSLVTISQYAFSLCISIEKIKIPKTVQIIEASAFKSCLKMRSIEFLGEDLTEISGYTFSGCTNLLEIILPNSIISIGLFAFEECKSMKKIFIGRSVKYIDSRAFIDCISLVNIEVSQDNLNFTNLEGDGVLYDKNYDTIIRFPEGKEIDHYFIPESIKIIDKNAFRDCVHIRYVYTNNNLIEFKISSFEGCKQLQEMVFPDSVKIIEYCAFQSCENLVKIVIGSGIQEIQFTAFKQCTSLKCIYYYGDKEPSIQQNAFLFINTTTVMTLNSYEGLTFGELNITKGEPFDDCPPIENRPKITDNERNE